MGVSPVAAQVPALCGTLGWESGADDSRSAPPLWKTDEKMVGCGEGHHNGVSPELFEENSNPGEVLWQGDL